MDLTATQMIIGAILLSGVVMAAGWLLRLYAIFVLVRQAGKLILLFSVLGAGGAAFMAPEGSIGSVLAWFSGGE